MNVGWQMNDELERIWKEAVTVLHDNIKAFAWGD
jgi:hypothetical protein